MHGRGPPSGAAVRCRDPVGVEARGDLAEGPTSGALVADALRDLGWDGRFASPRRWLKSRSCYPSPLDGQPLEFIDRDQLGTPWQLDRVDVRQQATERGAADAERVGSLGAGVGEPLDMVGLAYDDPCRSGDPWRRRDRTLRLMGRLEVPARLISAALLAAMRHSVRAYTNYGTILHLGASVSRLLLLYGGSAHSPAVEPAVEASALHVETAPKAMLELDHALHRLQGGPVLLTAENGEHARMVVGRRDRGT